jgi:hypothetical protein
MARSALPFGPSCASPPRAAPHLVEHHVPTIQRPDGSEKLVEQVLITARGLTKLSELLNAFSGFSAGETPAAAGGGDGRRCATQAEWI